MAYRMNGYDRCLETHLAEALPRRRLWKARRRYALRAVATLAAVFLVAWLIG